MQIVSDQGIKCPDEMGNSMWANIIFQGIKCKMGYRDGHCCRV